MTAKIIPFPVAAMQEIPVTDDLPILFSCYVVVFNASLSAYRLAEASGNETLAREAWDHVAAAYDRLLAFRKLPKDGIPVLTDIHYEGSY